MSKLVKLPDGNAFRADLIVGVIAAEKEEPLFDEESSIPPRVIIRLKMNFNHIIECEDMEQAELFRNAIIEDVEDIENAEVIQ